MNLPPNIDNAPGLTWKPRKGGWEARWQCRTDLRKRGYPLKSVGLWRGAEPSELEMDFIKERCTALQTEMLIWGRGGIATVSVFDGTLKSLIACYQTDKDSPYRKKRYHTRGHYDTLCRRLETDLGSKNIAELKARNVQHWNDEIMETGKVAMAHALVGQLRTLSSFGATFLEDTECERLCGVLSRMRFAMPKPRKDHLTAEQVVAVRMQAHEHRRPSIALAQAIQFEAMLRQRDVIGEWVPMSEPVLSLTTDGNQKWLRGIRWEEVNENYILTHITSKRQKEITVDLRLASMVMEELGGLPRSAYPATGPIIICETTGIPWSQHEFRRYWRKCATKAGVPKHVFNMDSRAGAITEATQAGAPLESIKQAATHSDIGMTQRYARGQEEKTADVQRARAEFRKNKPGTNEG